MGHVFETYNGGKSWTDISANLPDIASDALVISHGQLALGTDAGVFTAREGRGSSTRWSRLGLRAAERGRRRPDPGPGRVRLRRDPRPRSVADQVLIAEIRGWAGGPAPGFRVGSGRSGAHIPLISNLFLFGWCLGWAAGHGVSAGADAGQVFSHGRASRLTSTPHLEDARAQAAYGQHSFVGKILEIHQELPGRVHIVLVREPVGY